jgi:hypothetical protein
VKTLTMVSAQKRESPARVTSRKGGFPAPILGCGTNRS